MHMEKFYLSNRVFAGATVYVLLAEALQRVKVGIKEGGEEKEVEERERGELAEGKIKVSQND